MRLFCFCFLFLPSFFCFVFLHIFAFVFTCHSLSSPFSLPTGRNSDPGSRSRLSPPLPTTVSCLGVFTAIKLRPFPSSTRADLINLILV